MSDNAVLLYVVMSCFFILFSPFTSPLIPLERDVQAKFLNADSPPPLTPKGTVVKGSPLDSKGERRSPDEV